MAGLAERDRRVFRACAKSGVPGVVTLAGGDAARPEDTVAIPVNTAVAAADALCTAASAARE